MEKDKANKMSQHRDQKWESDTQKKIDKELQSDDLKDMHLESGEKINEYDVNE